VSGASIRTLLDATAPSNNSKMQAAITLRDYVAIAPDRSAVVVTATQPNTRGWSFWRVDLNDSRTSRLTRGSEDVAPNWAR